MQKKCPYYEEITVRYCKVLAKRILIPSRSEKEKFCICSRYKECPLYQEYVDNRNDKEPINQKPRKEQS
jgi:hypothetical protein